MIYEQEIGIILIFTGIVVFITGVIGLVIPYHPLHLITVGLLLFFAGYYCYIAVKKKPEKRTEKK